MGIDHDIDVPESNGSFYLDNGVTCIYLLSNPTGIVCFWNLSAYSFCRPTAERISITRPQCSSLSLSLSMCVVRSDIKDSLRSSTHPTRSVDKQRKNGNPKEKRRKGKSSAAWEGNPSCVAAVLIAGAVVIELRVITQAVMVALLKTIGTVVGDGSGQSCWTRPRRFFSFSLSLLDLSISCSKRT